MLKCCLDCKQELDVDLFYHQRTRNGKKYPMSTCKQCSILRVKQWRATPKGKLARKKYNLAKAFGMTLEDWDRMFVKQGGRCAICKREFSQLKMTPFVDHNHTTGQVRGLLCPVCNQFLGLVQDNPQSLLNYLNPNPGWPNMWIADTCDVPWATPELQTIEV